MSDFRPFLMQILQCGYCRSPEVPNGTFRAQHIKLMYSPNLLVFKFCAGPSLLVISCSLTLFSAICFGFKGESCAVIYLAHLMFPNLPKVRRSKSAPHFCESIRVEPRWQGTNLCLTCGVAWLRTNQVCSCAKLQLSAVYFTHHITHIIL